MVLPDLNIASTAAKLDTDRAFIWLKRNLTPKQQDGVNRLGIPGLYFQMETKRIYPQGSLTRACGRLHRRGQPRPRRRRAVVRRSPLRRAAAAAAFDRHPAPAHRA